MMQPSFITAKCRRSSTCLSPVAVTMKLPVPRVTDVFMNTMSLRSPRATSSPVTVAGSTGSSERSCSTRARCEPITASTSVSAPVDHAVDRARRRAASSAAAAAEQQLTAVFLLGLMGRPVGAPAVDLLAERIRSLGHPAPASYAAFGRLSSVPDTDGVPKALEMVKILVADHETVIRTARLVVKAAEDAGDQATADLGTQRLQIHEKTAWMLRSLLEE